MTDYTVTLYKLFLGNQDSVTGHYQRGFTVHSIEMLIFPRGTQINVGTGYYTRYALTGFTEYSVHEGDYVFDTFGRYYLIQSLKPWTSGDELAFYECELEMVNDFPFISDFFGFEDEDHGTIGYGYAEGYERGWFAL